MPRKPKELPADRIVPKVALTVEEAAWSLGISQTKIYKLVSEGRLCVSRIDGNTVFDPVDLAALRDRHKMVKNQGRSRIGPNGDPA